MSYSEILNDVNDWKNEMQVKWRNAKTTAARNRLVEPYIDIVGAPDDFYNMASSKQFKQKLSRLYGSKWYRRQIVADNFNLLCYRKDLQKLRNNEIDVKSINDAVNEWRMFLKSKNLETSNGKYDEADSFYLVIKPYKFATSCPLDYGRASLFDLNYHFSFYCHYNNKYADAGYFTIDSRASSVVFKSKNKDDLIPPKHLKPTIDEYINYEIIKSKKKNSV